MIRPEWHVKITKDKEKRRPAGLVLFLLAALWIMYHIGWFMYV